MAYSITIERQNVAQTRIPISRDEWESAVASTDGVRMLQGKIDLGNGIQIDAPGSAEVLDNTSGRWLPALLWSEAGYAQFNATDDFADPDSEFGKLVRSLAARLEAKLVGDEGEFYD